MKKKIKNEQIDRIIEYEKYNFKIKIVKRFTSIPVLTLIGFLALTYQAPEQISKALSIVADNVTSQFYLSISIAVNIGLSTMLFTNSKTINNQKARLSDKRVDTEINDGYNSSSNLDKRGVSKYDRD